jgi:hypothetical protein
LRPLCNCTNYNHGRPFDRLKLHTEASLL